MTNTSLFERRKKAVPRGVFNTAPIFAKSASGATITDVEDRVYIDFVGGIGVMNVGHCNPRVVEAIKAQAEQLIHSCFHIVMYEGYVALAEKLIELAPGDFEKKAALFNSGAEAVENAVKIARHATGRQGIMAFDGAFHGRTLLTMSLTSKVKPYKLGFGPYAPEIYRQPYPYCYRCPVGCEYPSCGIKCVDVIKKSFIGNAAAEHLAAVIIEPVTGEGGFIVPPREYFPKLKALCEENGILFIADEVQTGFGRTGSMLAMEHWGVIPDITVVAKSMGGGMPISGIVGRADLLDAPQIGGLGGTYGGNPVSCAASLAAIEELETHVLAKGQTLAAKARSAFDSWQQRYPLVGDVRGLGAMLALELVHDRTTKEPAPDKTQAMVARCRDNGLLLLACGNFGNVIRTLMPLVTSDAELEKGLAIMEEALAFVSAK
jgi:4-aminobutyrate aminotransferase/(S)-3-amino-2-methylpropionate transaminase